MKKHLKNALAPTPSKAATAAEAVEAVGGKASRTQKLRLPQQKLAPKKINTPIFIRRKKVAGKKMSGQIF